MMKRSNKIFIQWLMGVMIFSCAQSVVFAQDAPPVAMLKQTTSHLLTQLERNQHRLKNNLSLIDRFVRQILLPHADISYMAKRVIGPSAWRSASTGQRNEFVTRFTSLVIRTYSSALSSYDDDRVIFKPLRSKNIGKGPVLVRSVIVRKTGQRIPLSYRVMIRGNAWKVIDFSVDNISMTQSYRAQFSGVLDRGGMALLLKQLRSR